MPPIRAAPPRTTSTLGGKAINRLQAIQVSDTRQWIRIRVADASNPVLLLIQQGPGLPMINEARRSSSAHVHPHRFRHDTARRLVEVVDLPTVAALMGHSRLDTVRLYAQPDEAALERAAAALEMNDT